jgi:hypothetical protein
VSWVIYAVRLSSELALLVSVTSGGAALAAGTAGLVLAVSALVVAASIWGAWIAPRARRRLDDPLRLLVELALFVWGGAGLVLSGRPTLGVLLVVTGAVAAVAIRWVGEPIPGTDSAMAPRTR